MIEIKFSFLYVKLSHFEGKNRKIFEQIIPFCSQSNALCKNASFFVDSVKYSNIKCIMYETLAMHLEIGRRRPVIQAL